MERLTIKKEDGSYTFDQAASQLPLIMQKLGEMEDAEEQGKLIRFPCKVGETVYVLTPKKNDYIETDVKRIVVYDNDIEIVTCICVRSIKEIGKTVFFTREQAEKKINEQKEL